ncbi:MAG: hypothetical protein JGK37_09585 [Microcoleus sp. PH2017_06_SFM_O_A]|uniref:hypothetical protein n=1 Tax=Microcoleus sp. PH2017_18_LLB_O_A TaxID=2798829 RepID=UPI001E0D4C29|nr:hypothetical protein [Microcoleus sp. PH2017_18_LLB_O_A]MCC3466239.1 hypothetical protein [Microcoleus sp. PH2017_06_SFM_O_A]MCC3515763.1 hypothetical protein [Microcoleus sp. PH2017_18_LLB_O_A]
MKKLLILTLVILIAIFQFPANASAARPSYPWNSDQPYSISFYQTRHHIIPLEELVKFGTQTYTTQLLLTDFLLSYDNIKKVNLGEYKSIAELIKAYLDRKTPAVETMNGLFGWVQGNLVVGPQNRAWDPGNAFDEVAFDCRQNIYYNTRYTNLKKRWETPATKRDVFELLSTTQMSGIKTATNCNW